MVGGTVRVVTCERTDEFSTDQIFDQYRANLALKLCSMSDSSRRCFDAPAILPTSELRRNLNWPIKGSPQKFAGYKLKEITVNKVKNCCRYSKDTKDGVQKV